MRIAKFAKDIGPQTVKLLLTATATFKVAEDMCEQFDVNLKHLFRSSGLKEQRRGKFCSLCSKNKFFLVFRPNLSLLVHPCHQRTRDGLLLKLVRKQRESKLQGPIIVYCTAQSECVRVAEVRKSNL